VFVAEKKGLVERELLFYVYCFCHLSPLHDLIKWGCRRANCALTLSLLPHQGGPC
jgi:hypothetical protein